MTSPNQVQVQKQVTTQAIAQAAQVDNSPVNNKQTTAIASIPSTTPVDASNVIPAMINSPTVGAILALAVLVRVIIDRPSSDKK